MTNPDGAAPVAPQTDAYQKAQKARESLLEQTGFDLFTSPRFLEHLVCQMLGGEQTPHSAPYDLVTDYGTRVEIKSSQLSKHTYSFDRLRPHEKGAHLYVLVGHPGNGELDFFVIWASLLKLGKSKRIQIMPSSLRRKRDSRVWVVEASADELVDRVRRESDMVRRHE